MTKRGRGRPRIDPEWLRPSIRNSIRTKAKKHYDADPSRAQWRGATVRQEMEEEQAKLVSGLHKDICGSGLLVLVDGKATLPLMTLKASVGNHLKDVGIHGHMEYSIKAACSRVNLSDGPVYEEPASEEDDEDDPAADPAWSAPDSGGVQGSFEEFDPVSWAPIGWNQAKDIGKRDPKTGEKVNVAPLHMILEEMLQFLDITQKRITHMSEGLDVLRAAVEQVLDYWRAHANLTFLEVLREMRIGPPGAAA